MSVPDATVAAAAIERYFDHSENYAHADALAVSTDGLVLERLPSGNFAWLRPETVTHDAEDDDALYWPTADGRELIQRWRLERHVIGREVS